MRQLGFIFILGLLLSSCGRIENSSSQDKATYSPRLEGSSQYNDAMAIIEAKCAVCHNHASWVSFSEADFVSTGLVLGQNPIASPIYYRNQLGPGPDNNMPTQGLPAMTSNELQTISIWINTITP